MIWPYYFLYSQNSGSLSMMPGNLTIVLYLTHSSSWLLLSFQIYKILSIVILSIHSSLLRNQKQAYKTTISLFFLAALGLSCGTRDLHCGMWDPLLRRVGSLLQHADFSLVVACGLLSSCGLQAPEHLGSVVAAYGLSCPMACGILVPQWGIKPAYPALEGRFLTTGPPGKLLKKTTISLVAEAFGSSTMFILHFLYSKKSIVDWAHGHPAKH